MHKLLARQLRRHGLQLDELPEPVRKLLGDISAAYGQTDEDREMMERSLELTSQDLIGRNKQLRSDIAEKERAQEALRQLLQRWQLLFQQTPLAVIEWDRDFHVLEWNPGAERLFGIPRDHALGRRGPELVATKAHAARVEEQWRQLLSHSGFVSSTSENATREGKTIYCEWYNTPIVDQQGQVGSVSSLIHDVTERVRSEQALQRSEEEFRLLAVATQEGLLIHHRGEILLANPALTRLAGWDPALLLAHRASELLSPDTPADLLLREGGPHECAGRRQDGSTFDAELHVKAIRYRDRPCHLVSLRDVTERRKLQARLMLSDRMASVGTLAAGVAHEINNPLAYVAANLDYARSVVEQLAQKQGVPGLGDALEALTEAKEGAERVRNIVRDLKTFSRSEEDKREAVDVASVLGSSISMALNEIKHRAKLVRQLDKVPEVHGNASRLGQVFLNLLVNAAQAIPEGAADRNEIRVSTRLAEDGMVEVTVSDSGPGIRPEHLSRIFDPFFTTKGDGGGTGLGLSICHSIVTQLGGDIQVDGGLGTGATFRVRLQQAQATQERAKKPADLQQPMTSPGRLLVIDDEPMVRSALRRLLEPRYAVRLAESAREALQLLQEPPGFDLVLCDLMMPDQSGMDLYETVQKSVPSQAERFVFVSGGAFTERASRFLESIPPTRKLEKPVDPPTLRRLLDGVLRERGPLRWGLGSSG